MGIFQVVGTHGSWFRSKKPFHKAVETVLYTRNEKKAHRERIVEKKAKKGEEGPSPRPARKKLSVKETLKRMREFDKRKDAFIAAIREGKNRSVSS